MLAPGDIIADKYRLERVIGRGGMGMVIEARHVELGTSFALKFLYNKMLAKKSLAERFLREARATAALRSEHVCRVFDVARFQGTPYIVMERLEGSDLGKVLHRQARIPVREACDYLIQACAGIAEAHAAQIVHRDLKPGNLFVTERADGTPLVKILDFGIAKTPQETDLELTGTDVILGSPSYMSLEQLRSSKQVDARSDIWSLGVILYELVAGRKPFAGEGLADLALKIATQPRPRLPEGPAALDDIIDRCLAHDPARRYQSAGELARALAPFADDPARRLAASIGRTARGSSPAGAGAPSAIPTAPRAEDRAAPPSVISTAPRVEAPAAPPVQTAVERPQPGAVAAGSMSILPTTRMQGFDGPEPSSGEIVKPAPVTTMQTAGEIASSPLARGPGFHAKVIILTVGITGGILLGVVASGVGEGDAGSTLSIHPVGPPSAPQSSPLPDASTPGASVSDAAITAPEDEAAIELEPGARAGQSPLPAEPPPPAEQRSLPAEPPPPPAEQSPPPPAEPPPAEQSPPSESPPPEKSPPPSPAKRKPRPAKKTDQELGKSRR